MKASEGKHVQTSPHTLCDCCHLEEGQAGIRNNILHSAPCCLVFAALSSSSPQAVSPPVV